MLLLIWPYRSFLTLGCCFFVTIYRVLTWKSILRVSEEEMLTLKWINGEDQLVFILQNTPCVVWLPPSTQPSRTDSGMHS